MSKDIEEAPLRSAPVEPNSGSWEDGLRPGYNSVLLVLEASRKRAEATGLNDMAAYLSGFVEAVEEGRESVIAAAMKRGPDAVRKTLAEALSK